MIYLKENVVRYTVEIDSENEFESVNDEAEYLLQQFVLEGMDKEAEKMKKKGFSFRLVEKNAYFKTYTIEYVSKTSF